MLNMHCYCTLVFALLFFISSINHKSERQDFSFSKQDETMNYSLHVFQQSIYKNKTEHQKLCYANEVM